MKRVSIFFTVILVLILIFQTIVVADNNTDNADISRIYSLSSFIPVTEEEKKLEGNQKAVSVGFYSVGNGKYDTKVIIINKNNNIKSIDLGCTGNATTDEVLEKLITQYYRDTLHIPLGDSDFKCKINDPSYREVIVDYKYSAPYIEENKVYLVEKTGHTTIYTNYDFSIGDVRLDLSDGKLIVSNTLYSDTDAWNIMYDSFELVITGITGCATLVCIVAFILQILKLGMAAGNPSEREKAVKGVLWTGIGTAGLGAATLIFSITFKLFA